jgi:hypothetical protein
MRSAFFVFDLVGRNGILTASVTREVSSIENAL